MAHLGFDATQVQPDTGQLDPIPAGWYNAMVDESELKPTSDGLGARLAVRFNIIDGQYANRKIYTGFNIRNANPVAQEIAFKQLSALAHAVGVLQVQDSQQLHGIPLKIRVKIRPPQNGYEAQNDISAYKNINYIPDKGGDASAPAGMGAPAAPAGFGTAAQPAAPAAAPAAGGAGWGGAPAQPWQQPSAAAPAAASAPPPFTPPAPPAPAAADFPPAGWTAHPTAAGYFYKDQEVLSEADLRAKTAAPPPAPAAPPAAPAAPDPAATAQVAIPPWQQPKA